MNDLNISLANEMGLDYDEFISDPEMTKEEILFCEWFFANEENIVIELAESGADREMDFDIEAEFEKRYQEYLEKQEVF